MTEVEKLARFVRNIIEIACIAFGFYCLMLLCVFAYALLSITP